MFGQRKIQEIQNAAQETLRLTVQAFQHTVEQLVQRETATLGQLHQVYRTAMDEVLKSAHLVAAMAQAQVDRGASRILTARQGGATPEIPDPFADESAPAADGAAPDPAGDPTDDDITDDDLLGFTPPGEELPALAPGSDAGDPGDPGDPGGPGEA